KGYPKRKCEVTIAESPLYLKCYNAILMVIEETLVHEGNRITFEWHDADTFDDLPWEECTQVYGICVRNDGKVGLVTYDDSPDNLAGGSIEHEEDGDIDTALKREIKEELNAQVLRWL